MTEYCPGQMSSNPAGLPEATTLYYSSTPRPLEAMGIIAILKPVGFGGFALAVTSTEAAAKLPPVQEATGCALVEMTAKQRRTCTSTNRGIRNL